METEEDFDSQATKEKVPEQDFMVEKMHAIAF